MSYITRNASNITMATKPTILETSSEKDDDFSEQQTRLYIIIITSFFLFFFSIVGYVFYNQWKRVREQNREKFKASEIEKEGKPMLSRKESVIGQGQKVVVIERRMSRNKRLSPDDDDVEAEKKISTNSAPSLSNDTAKTFYKLRNDHPNQPVMIRYTNDISTRCIKDLGNFNSLGDKNDIHRGQCFPTPSINHTGMLSPHCSLYNPVKVPFSNCNALRIHALQNDGFAPSGHESPHISCEIFPSLSNGCNQNEDCQIKYQHGDVDGKISSTETTEHYQLQNDMCRSVCNCNKILTVSNAHHDHFLSVNQNTKTLRKNSATQTSMQDINANYTDQIDGNQDEESDSLSSCGGKEPLLSVNQKKGS